MSFVSDFKLDPVHEKGVLKCFFLSEFWEILANPILPRDGLDINCTHGKHVAREALKENVKTWNLVLTSCTSHAGCNLQRHSKSTENMYLPSLAEGVQTHNQR